MNAPRAPSWRISLEAGGTFRAAIVSSEGVELYVIGGWTSERACAQFLALYLVLAVQSKADDATRLLRSFMHKEPPAGSPS